MDSTSELLEVVRELRAQLVRRAALGTWAAPAGPTARGSVADDGIVGPSVDARSSASGSAPEGTGPSTSAVDHADGRDPVRRGSMDADARPSAVDAVDGRSQPRAVTRGSIDADADVHARQVDPAERVTRIGRRTLASIREEVGDCQRCKLAATRTKLVYGVGAEDAPLVFVGEAPGEREDRTGEPFVGPAGELLDKMIEAMGWTRQHVYITNTLMCRPPGNRNPQPDELGKCMPFLEAKLDSIAPRIIVALGRPAANNLLQNDAPISALRGAFHDRRGARVMPTFHPAYLLREPARKRDTWDDLKLVIAELARLGIHSPNPPRA